MSNFVSPPPESPLTKKIKKEIREKLEKESQSGENKTAAKVVLGFLKFTEQTEKLKRW